MYPSHHEDEEDGAVKLDTPVRKSLLFSPSKSRSSIPNLANISIHESDGEDDELSDEEEKEHTLPSIPFPPSPPPPLVSESLHPISSYPSPPKPV